MKLYHGTDAVAAIEREGFRDGHGSYMTDQQWSGVWFSDAPLLDHAVAGFFEVEPFETEDLSEWEWVQQGLGYREFLVPADVANRWPRRFVPAEVLRRELATPW